MIQVKSLENQSNHNTLQSQRSFFCNEIFCLIKIKIKNSYNF